jgi:CHAT domain-containing protein
MPVLLLAGCANLGTSGGAAVSQPVGNNLVGEACRTAPARGGSGVTGGQASDIYCGRWEQPSARVLRIENGGSTLAQQVATGPWRDRLDAIAVCREPVPTTLLDGQPALALDCTLRSGGWPYRAVAVAAGNDAYLADGIPAAEPAMLRAIGLTSGRLAAVQETEQGGAAAREMAAIEARLAGRLYSAGDLQAYDDTLKLAQYNNYLGNYAEAESRYRDALALQQKALPDDSGSLAFVLMHIALELSNQERFAEADVLFERTDLLVQRSLDPSDQARLVGYRAIHLANQQRDKEAVELARKATGMRLDIARQYGASVPTPGVARPQTVQFGGAPTVASQVGQTVLVGRAQTALGDAVQSKYVEAAMLVRENRLDEATKTLAEANAILDADARIPRRWAAQVQVLQADIAERRGDLPRAERLLRSAIAIQRAQFAQSRDEGMALVALGRVQAKQGRSADAFESYRAGFALLARNGGDLRFDEVAAFFAAALDEAKRRPQDRDALFVEMFEAGQMVRGSTTAQTLALVAARLSAGEERVGAAIRDLQDARRERDQIQELLTRSQGDQRLLAPQLDALKQQYAAADARVAELERAVQSAAPRYNQLLDTPVSAADVRQALRPDEALVQVLLGATGGVGFVVDAESIEAYAIPLTEAETARAVATLRRPFDQPKVTSFDVVRAHALHQLLLGPVSERLAGVKHLITVPSGPLLSLPFAILVTREPSPVQGGDYSQIAWLGREHALTLSPSVQSFVNLRNTVLPSQAGKPMVGFGDFVAKREVDAILSRRGLPEACRKDVLAVAEAPALPNTATELRAVASQLGAGSDSIYLGNAFSEQHVKQLPLADYRVVYFATHGLLPEELNCWNEPSLVTSEPPGEAGDGLLAASEIVALQLDADLVVLSACNTGGPDGVSGGESLSGLARSFFYAGARSILVTHWQIPDEPTVRLMTGTFGNLAGGDMPAAEALRRSQVALIGTPATSHPLRWGAFTLVGDGGQRFALPRGTPAPAS